MARRAQPALEVEPLPEADRLEGFPHPRETAALFGHEAAERTLARMLASGRMPHAWLLAGPQGVGKATLAYRFAAYALSPPELHDPSGSSLAVPAGSIPQRQVTALSHPELLVIRRPFDPKTKRFAATIPIDEVRRLKALFSHTSPGEGWRIAIVDQADELNVNSANALLKSLEEPPARTVIMLISAQPGRLLPTIRSRCRLLRLSPLPPDALRRAAEAAFARSQHEPPGEGDWERLITLSMGSVRRLLTLSTADGLRLDDAIRRILSGLPSIDWGIAHALAEELAAPAAQQRFETFYDLLLGTVARMAQAEARSAPEPGRPSSPEKGGQESRAAAWAALWEDLVREQADALALNLDRRALIVDALARMASAART
jgi:DNA polymerase-3 subunit delta'